MSIRLARNVDFSASRRMVMPVPGVMLWSFFGGTLDDSRRNYATADADPLTVVGTPIVGPNYVDCLGLVDFFDTNMVLPQDFTFVAVARPLADIPTGTASPHLISALRASGGAFTGASLSIDGPGPGNVRTSASGTISGSPNTRRNILAPVPDWTTPRCYAGVLQRNGMIRSYDLTGGVMAEGLDTRTEVAPPPENDTLRIGSSSSGTVNYGPVRMYSAAILGRAVSAAELRIIHGQIQRYHAVDGLAV